jgi:TolA-binding protein
MTQCNGTPADQWLESYVAGNLPESEAQSFEEHYFECSVCLAQVEALQAVALQLGARPRRVLKAPIPWPTRFSAIGAIAAMLVLGFFAVRERPHPARPLVASGPAASTPQSQPAQQPAQPAVATLVVSRLADLVLPPYQASNLRGQSRDPNFDAGMKAYTGHDCPDAERSLAQVQAQDQDALTAQFYLGVCEMHEGDMAAAAKTLNKVAGVADAPQQEAAMYYLAQIALRGKDVQVARRYLAHTVQLHGDFEARARAELIQIRGVDINK